MKKIILIALSVIMAVALVSCSMVSVNEDKDNAQVIAKVGDTQLLKGDFQNYIDSSLSYYGMTLNDYKAQVDKASYDKFITDAITGYVDNEIMYQEAVKKGLEDNSEENKTKIKEEIQATYDSYREMLLQNVDPAITDEAKRKEEAEKQLQEILGDTADIDKQVSDTIKQNATNAIYEELTKDATFTEEDAKKYYDEQLKIQQDTMANSEDAEAVLAMYQQFGETVYVRPENARYVKHILIEIPEDKKTEITALKSEGKEAEAQKLLDEELAKIKPAADEAHKRATGTENFDTLIEELGKDPGMTQEPAKTEGYLVYKGSGMVAPFEEAALALAKEGDISAPVASDFGYHIIKFEKAAGGAIPFEELKDSIMSNQLSQKQKTAYEEGIAALKANYKVETFPNVLES